MRYVRAVLFCDGSPSSSRYLCAVFSLISAILAESIRVLPIPSSRRSSLTRPSVTIATSMKIRRYNDQRFSHSSGILIVAESAPRPTLNRHSHQPGQSSTGTFNCRQPGKLIVATQLRGFQITIRSNVVKYPRECLLGVGGHLIQFRSLQEETVEQREPSSGPLWAGLQPASTC